MEINLLDEDAKIENINNLKALRYPVKDNGKNVDEIPVFKNWLNLMKSEKGENGIVCYCVNCHLFFYFINTEEKKFFVHNPNCISNDYAEFCEYCGELFADISICCYKKGFYFIKREIYDSFDDDIGEYCIFIPFISLLFYFARIFHVIVNIRKKGKNINYKNESFLDYSKFAFVIFVLFGLLYSLIYSLIYTIVYFFHLIIILRIRKQNIKDKEANFVRY